MYHPSANEKQEVKHCEQLEACPANDAGRMAKDARNDVGDKCRDAGARAEDGCEPHQGQAGVASTIIGFSQVNADVEK